MYNKTIDFISSTMSTINFVFSNIASPPNNYSSPWTPFVIPSTTSVHSTDIIYLDFRKALDTISHPELLFKLLSAGIAGNLALDVVQILLIWSQTTSLHQQPKFWFASCPLCGSSRQHLGPLRFIIYINDLTTTIKYSLPFFIADDTKCLSKIKSPTDSTLLLKDLKSIHSWGIQWSRTFNEL